jgi:ArsR family transcriptional regulator
MSKTPRQAPEMKPLPPDAMCCNPDDCAAAMKVLADPNRIRIVRALVPGPRNVGDIARAAGLSPHRVSHHLGRMRLAGLVEARREGRSIVYRVHPRVATAGGLDLGCSRILFRALP